MSGGRQMINPEPEAVTLEEYAANVEARTAFTPEFEAWLARHQRVTSVMVRPASS